MFFSACMHCAPTMARTQFFISAALCSFVQLVCERKVIEYSCSTVSLKLSCAPSALCSGTHTIYHLVHLRFAYRHRSLFDSVTKMCNNVCQQTATHSEHQDRSAHVLQPDVGEVSGPVDRTALSTCVCVVWVFLLEVGIGFSFSRLAFLLSAAVDVLSWSVGIPSCGWAGFRSF